MLTAREDRPVETSVVERLWLNKDGVTGIKAPIATDAAPVP